MVSCTGCAGCGWLWLCVAGSWAVCTVYTKLHTTTAYHKQHNQCTIPYAVVHGLVLLMMGIMMPETCWDRSLIINIGLVASCWFPSRHPTFMKHGHNNLKGRHVRNVASSYTVQGSSVSITDWLRVGWREFSYQRGRITKFRQACSGEYPAFYPADTAASSPLWRG